MVISAIVVLFHPNKDKVLELINCLCGQVDFVIVVDNTPIKNDNSYGFEEYEKIFLISNGENIGLAKAQNKGLSKAIDLGADYFILFDQDSSVQDDFCESLLATYKKLELVYNKIAAVGPCFLDIKTGHKSPAITLGLLRLLKTPINDQEFYTKADYIISSGSLISYKSLKEIGLMKEELFIDFIDIEWGLRAKMKEYPSFISNNTIMYHSIGDKVFKIPVLNKFLNIHSDFRKYFIIRNAIYLIIYSNLSLNWKVMQLFKCFGYIVLYSLSSKSIFNSLRISFYSFCDAVFKRMGKTDRF